MKDSIEALYWLSPWMDFRETRIALVVIQIVAIVVTIGIAVIASRRLRRQLVRQ